MAGRGGGKRAPQPPPPDYDSDSVPEEVTPQIMPLKEARIFLLGGIRADGEQASCCSWNGEYHSATKGRNQGLVVAQPPRKETDIQNKLGNARPRSGCSAAMIKNRLWVTGGFAEFSGILRSVVSRDKMSARWRTENKMITRRDGHCAVSYDDGSYMSEGALVVMGGNGGSTFLNSVERAAVFHAGQGIFQLQRWEEIPRMLFKRGNFTAVNRTENKDHSILAVGGFSDGKRVTDSCERLDLKAGEWVVERGLTEARAGHAACYLGERLFVCGGTDGNSALASCEAFDRREGRWKPTVPMNKARVNHGLVSHNGTLMAIGGRCYLDRVQLSEIASMEEAAARANKVEGEFVPATHPLTEWLQVVEVYDERKAEWQQVLARPEEANDAAMDRSSMACCVW